RIAELFRWIPVAQVLKGVERLHLDLGAGSEGLLAFGRALDGAAVGRGAPLLGARAHCWRCRFMALRLDGLLRRLALHCIAHAVTLGSFVLASLQYPGDSVAPLQRMGQLRMNGDRRLRLERKTSRWEISLAIAASCEVPGGVGAGSSLESPSRPTCLRRE